LIRRIVGFAGVGVLAAGLVATAAPALAIISPYSITFQAAGGSAAWTDVHQTAVALTVNNVSGYAVIDLHGFTVGANLPTTEPVLTVTHYASGTPRLEIVPSGPDSIANDVTGYPDPSLCGKSSGICWSVPPNTNSYNATYADVQSYINGHGGIHAAYIVADGSQATPYTSDVNGFTWDGATLVPAARFASLRGKYVCGVNKDLRRYLLTNIGNTDAHTNLLVKTHTSHGIVWAWFAGDRVVPAGGSITVTTHFGFALRADYNPDGSLPAKNQLDVAFVTISANRGPACDV
jgi:hypothetical protein